MTNGAQVLDQTRAFLARFCTFPSDAALDATTAWVAHSHVRGTNGRLAFMTSPRLVFLSDKPASGKSKALELVTRLAYHGDQVLDPTPATFAQMLGEGQATPTIDEVDVLFGRGASKATLRSLLNGGYRTGAKWSRANKEPVSVFGPVALAGLGKRFRVAPELEPLRTRSIIVEMEPATPGESYRERVNGPLASAIRDSLTTWAKRNLGDIVECFPQDVPEGIADRMLEVAEPLLCICDTAGGRWPGAIREAMKELLLGEIDADDELSLTDSLLVSLRQVFADREKMSTLDLIDGLYALPGTPWRKLWPNETTAPRELAMMAAPFGIEPVPVRLGDKVLRGYHRQDFEPLWAEFDADDITSVTSVAVTSDCYVN